MRVNVIALLHRFGDFLESGVNPFLKVLNISTFGATFNRSDLEDFYIKSPEGQRAVSYPFQQEY